MRGFLLECNNRLAKAVDLSFIKLRGIIRFMAVWEQVLLGVAALIMLFFFWPGVKVTLARSRAVENPDWKSALIPLGLVVLFVVLLIAVSRS
jgi:cytochrome c oxidase assembly factor CtaG